MGGCAEQAAVWKGPMNTVLDEVTSETVDAAHIRRRVEDWEERLNGLFAMIGEWLPEGWESRRGAPVLMHEELMRKFGVAAKPMPTLEIHGRMGHVARLEPRALWDHRRQWPRGPQARRPTLSDRRPSREFRGDGLEGGERRTSERA